MKNKKLKIYAGHCSANPEYEDELYEIAHMAGIWGIRIVGLKSRTKLDANGQGMGIDYEVYQTNERVLLHGGSTANLQVPPSVILAERIHKETSCAIATEIMNPLVQLPLYAGKIAEGKLLIWNPSVNQLGWPLHTMGKYGEEHEWTVGIKNGKWTDSIEKTWTGLTTYTNNAKTILIHRGFESANKGEYRNFPRHDIATDVKSRTGCQMYLDPSHMYGSKMRDRVVSETITAMRMTMGNGSYLYDGILIEVGTSETDSDQHISIHELQTLVLELSASRDLVEP